MIDTIPQGYKNTEIGIIPNDWQVKALGTIGKFTKGQDAYKRYFSKYTQSTNQKVSDYFYSWSFDSLHFDNFTLDIDTSVMTRYGEQEGAKRIVIQIKKEKNNLMKLNKYINN